ncbi:MAG: response regulator [Geitlerinemataceae cyanobacterium]
MDSTIRDQGYVYFLSEAPELLQTVEDGLLHIHDAPRVQNVHALMRATHTLKGAAANVGLKTIETIAHSLEDAFKALYNEEVEIDLEIEQFLLEGYECLRVPLGAELTGTTCDEDAALDRAATLFEKLRDKLGDDFGQQEYIPSSAELGFDITQSIFEMGVQERIDELAAAVASGDGDQVTQVLAASCEVFVGLGESLGLMGWSELAKTATKALKTHPDRALEIGQVALEDFKTSHRGVLGGDRESGGAASERLLALADADRVSPPLDEILGIPPAPPLPVAAELEPESVANAPISTPTAAPLESPLAAPVSPLLDSIEEFDETDDDLAELEALAGIPLDGLDDIEEVSAPPLPSQFVRDLERFEAFLDDPRHGKPVRGKIREFFLQLVRAIAHWHSHETETPIADFSLELLVLPPNIAQLRNKKRAIQAVKALRDLGDRFLDATASEGDGQSYRLYRKWTFLSAMVAIAKCQCAPLTRYPKSFKDVPFVIAVRQLAKNVGDHYQALPPIPNRQRQWLETPAVEQLFQPTIATPLLPTALDDANLLEEVWGEIDDGEVDSEIESGDETGEAKAAHGTTTGIEAETVASAKAGEPTESPVSQQPLPPAEAAESAAPAIEGVSAFSVAAMPPLDTPAAQTNGSPDSLPDSAPDSRLDSSPDSAPSSSPDREPAATVARVEIATAPPVREVAPAADLQVSVTQTVESKPLEPQVAQGEFADAASKPAPEAIARKLPAEARQLVSVDLAGIERLNHRLGELLIEQNRLALDEERLFEASQAMQQQIQHHHKTMLQALEWSEQIMGLMERAGDAYEGKSAPGANGSVALAKLDSVDFDGYADLHLTLKTALQQALDLEIEAGEVNSLVRGSGQAMDKQKQLLSVMQDDLVDVRMLPLQEILDRFERVLRQLSRIQGKKIDLHIGGGELAIEQGVAQKLYEPLLHLVRNAFDHGIEDADTRRNLGKPEVGTIEIRAYNQGTQTTIEVRDDGRGLNVDNIRKKAVEKGFLTQEQAGRLISSDRLDILFEPGFSTAPKVSEISGRGVGLDVVRTQIQNLKGTISVKSELGGGTVFALQIPLSLTIAKLLVVQAGGSAYALLLDAIEKIVMPLPGQTRLFENSKVLQIGEGEETSMVSVRQLADLMHYTSSLVSAAEEPTKSVMSISRDVSAPILLLRHNSKYLGLEVDHIIGEQELVIRPLGSAIASPDYVYGCSILSDSSLCLVIDGGEMIERALTPMRSAAPAAAIGFKSFAVDAPARELAAPSETLVLGSAAPRTLDAAPTEGVAPQGGDLLLVVDDSINLRHTLSLTLQKAGYQVVQARDGLEALEQLERSPEIQLILCDVEMPRMNGFEFLGTYRQNNDLSHVPVITLTSHSSQKYRQIASSLGASAYLTKPYSESELLSTISELV